MTTTKPTTMQIAHTLASTPGILAALVIDADVRNPHDDEVFRRSTGDLTTKLVNPEGTLQMAAKIFSLEGKPTRVTIGEKDPETLVCVSGSDRICVVSVVAGHPIMKSIKRMLERALRGRSKTAPSSSTAATAAP